MFNKSRKQIIRLIRFVAELKNNSYPNAQSFAKKLRNVDIDENLNISCDSRTVQRDIKVLKDDFNAPIKYDHEQQGYYLTRKSWEFHCPVYCEGIISSFMISARLTEDIIPQPLKGEITNASSEIKTSNNSEFLDSSFMESLLIASGTKAFIKPVIFKKVFDGWRKRESLSIVYKKPDNSQAEHHYEPHIIAFHKGIWYTKGFFVENNKEIVLAIQRVKSAELTNKFFEVNKPLLEKIKKNGLFNYPKINDIILHCDSSIAFYFYEHQKAKKFKIFNQEDGSLIVKLAPAIEHDVIKWILGEGGKVQVLEPDWLRDKVVKAAENIISANSISKKQ